MMKLRRMFMVGDTYRRWRKGEAGMGDAALAMFILPFMMALIFVLLETGYNLRIRAAIDATTQDAARGVAQDGADYWDVTDTSGGVGWSQWGSTQLKDLCDRTGRCTGTPTMNCFPKTIQPNPGEPVTCTATWTYKPIAPFTSNSLFSLGFSGIWNGDITNTVTSRTVVGKG